MRSYAAHAICAFDSKSVISGTISQQGTISASSCGCCCGCSCVSPSTEFGRLEIQHDGAGENVTDHIVSGTKSVQFTLRDPIVLDVSVRFQYLSSGPGMVAIRVSLIHSFAFLCLSRLSHRSGATLVVTIICLDQA